MEHALATDVFTPIVFIEDGEPAPLRDPAAFPFLYNEHGKGVQLAQQRGTLIQIAPDNPDLDVGTRYVDIQDSPSTITPDAGDPYEITLFDFGVEEVHYAPLPATRENAQAFGMTLLRNGECVRFPFQNLVMTDYTYGKWAGYQSPYLGPGRSRELLTINPTDLEYHNFPHVFFSRDALPLVVSVARWRPYVRQIALADLWIAPGDAILLPPKVKPAPPPRCAPHDEARRIILDLHGNRNSALACRFQEGRPALSTTTILANAATMTARATMPHYHEEKSATRHVRLQVGDR
ncbi:hypothetical protein D3870_20650 [Noviherbaspirillum cavernae]|uniref:DUF2169 domain-containing protein n=2 Tax=Noviherbaspirillum cavernae TaxID=2320862 RepID=A0A418WWI4_9BURK|nr:hypothetical protein D3870_20650 [Noviherbaspirillum cavernae]